MSWCSEIEWRSPAGETLLALIAALPRDREFHLTLFGSSPLQLALEKTFTSADVDLFADATHELVETAISAAGLGKGQRNVYIQLCAGTNFRTSPRWAGRTAQFRREHCHFILPHPVDLLIAKMHRCDEKDLRAFRLVIERTGHPTEVELKEELQAAVDLYRPSFDEEVASDITTGTRIVWNEIFGRDINVRQEIIAPAIRRRNAGYADDLPREDYVSKIRELGTE